MFPIVMLNIGEKAFIEEIFFKGSFDQKYCGRLESMGLRSGAQIQVLKNDGRGPVVVMVANSRIALARGIAKKIMVNKSQD